jgi:Ca-activated chloride channel family protein
MSFDRPALLYALAPVALLVLAGTWRSRAALPPWRLLWGTATRLAVASLALLALADPRLPVEEALHRPVAYLIDVSDSIPLAAREAALRRIARLARSAGPDAEQWVIAFAGGARAHRLGDPGAVESDAALRELLLFPALEAEARRVLERTAAAPPALEVRAAAESTLQRIAGLRRELDPSETDLHAALRGLGGCPAGGRSPALVLVTDGRTTRPFGPSGWAALREAAGAVTLVDAGGADPGIVVESVSAPAAVDAGQPFDAVVRFTARGGESAHIRLLVDDRPQGDQPHACVPGPNVATIPRLAVEEPGFHRLQVIVESEGDPEPRNNVGIALVHVGAAPEVLLVEGRPGLAAHLESALQVQGIRAERVEAARLPLKREPLARFGAVMLVGVDADQIPDAAAEALRGAVEDDGVGLLFAGGPHLTGAKGWRGRPAERLLPVAFAPYEPAPPSAPSVPAPPSPPSPAGAPPSAPKPVIVEAGAISLCLLIDKSGSMAGENIRLAREAAIAAAETLGEGDSVSVIAFDVEPKLVLEPTAATRKDFIRDRIARIQADGGTNIYPALQLAFRILRDDAAQIRHAIVMSDGITQIADYQGLLGQMRASRITVSSICVASDLTFDWTTMHNLAVWGGGRFYPALSFKEVPQIFTKETKVVVEGREKDRAAREQRERALAAAAAARPATPSPSPAAPAPPAPPEIPLRIAAEEDPVRGLAGATLPSVDGLLPAAARPASVTCIAAADGRPALVLGRAGLGRTAAWLADWSDAWGRRWLGWDRFPAFAAQVARHLLRRGSPDRFPGTVAAAIRDDRVRVAVDFGEAAARRPEGRFVLQAAWRQERGPEHPLELRPSGPTTAEAEFPAPPAGEPAFVRVRLRDGDRVWEAPPVGVARAYPEELAGTSATAFADAAGAGIPPAVPLDAADLPSAPPPPAGRRTAPLAAPLLAAALLLLPVDIALRRLRI